MKSSEFFILFKSSNLELNLNHPSVKQITSCDLIDYYTLNDPFLIECMEISVNRILFFFCLLLLMNTGSSQGISITGTVEANTLSGTLSSTAMNSITSVGSLSGLTITGTISGGTFSGTLANSIVGIAKLSATGTPSSTTFLRGDNTWATPVGGTVTTVSVTAANGISGSVLSSTSTPAITLSLGAITPTSIVTSGSITATGTLSGSSIIKSGGTSSQFLKADGSTDANTYLTSAGAVTSITGTANEIDVSASTGSVTLSLPAAVSGLTSLTATNLTGTLTSGSQDNITSLGGVTSITTTSTVSVPANNLLVGGNIVPNTVFAVAHLPGALAATATNYSAFFIADRAYTIVAIRESHTTVGSNGGAVTLGVSKLTSGQALGTGVTTMSGTFNLKGTINTPVTATLTSTSANLDLAVGDRLELVDGGTLTAVAGVTVVVTLKAK